MSELDELIEVLQHLKNQQCHEKYYNTLHVIANLMNELESNRRTSASYLKTFKHEKLIITINYGEENVYKK